MRRTSSTLVAALSAALVLACGDGEDDLLPSPDPAINGTYQLRAINDRPLPYIVPGEGGVTFTAGSLVIDRPDSLTINTTYHYGDLASTFAERYAYTRQGSGVLLFRSGGGGSWTLAGNGAEVSYSEPGIGPGDAGLRFRFVK